MRAQRILMFALLPVFALGMLSVMDASAQPVDIRIIQVQDDEVTTPTTPGPEVTPPPNGVTPPTVSPPPEPPPPAVVPPPDETVPPPEPTTPAPEPVVPEEPVPDVTITPSQPGGQGAATGTPPVSAITIDELPTTGADLLPLLVAGFGLAATGTLFYRKRS